MTKIAFARILSSPKPQCAQGRPTRQVPWTPLIRTLSALRIELENPICIIRVSADDLALPAVRALD
jgi:hypothetical protein